MQHADRDDEQGERAERKRLTELSAPLRCGGRRRRDALARRPAWRLRKHLFVAPHLLKVEVLFADRHVVGLGRRGRSLRGPGRERFLCSPLSLLLFAPRAFLFLAPSPFLFLARPPLGFLARAPFGFQPRA